MDMDTEYEEGRGKGTEQYNHLISPSALFKTLDEVKAFYVAALLPELETALKEFQNEELYEACAVIKRYIDIQKKQLNVDHD